MIAMRRAQLSFGDGLIAQEISDLREAWIIHADAVLADDAIVSAVYEASAKRHPTSRNRGRPGVPAETVLRLLVLKHLRNWSYDAREREVRANLVYRDFTRVGAGKVPDAKTMGRWGLALGPQVLEAIHARRRLPARASAPPRHATSASLPARPAPPFFHPAPRPFVRATAHGHVGDALATLDAEAFRRCFEPSVSALVKSAEAIAFEGKAPRRSGSGKNAREPIHPKGARKGAERLQRLTAARDEDFLASSRAAWLHHPIPLGNCRRGLRTGLSRRRNRTI